MGERDYQERFDWSLHRPLSEHSDPFYPKDAQDLAVTLAASIYNRLHKKWWQLMGAGAAQFGMDLRDALDKELLAAFKAGALQGKDT